MQEMAPQHFTRKPAHVPTRDSCSESATDQSMSSRETVTNVIKRISPFPWAAKLGGISALPSFCPAPTPEDLGGGDGVVRTDPAPVPPSSIEVQVQCLRMGPGLAMGGGGKKKAIA